MSTVLREFKKPKVAAVVLGASLLIALVAWRMVLTKDRIGSGFAGSESNKLSYAGEPSAVVQGRMDASIMATSGSTKMAAAPSDFYGARGGATAAEADQKIIKIAALDLMVKNVPDAAVAVGNVATSRNGFIQSSSVQVREDGAYSGSVVVRVPIASYEASISEMRKLATLVRNETSNGQDVTERYTDLEAQFHNAQAQEQTYLEILKQAKSVEDVLKVQERLGAIRGQIESLQGQIKYLGNATSYSTISVSLSEEPIVRAPTRAFRPLAILKVAVQTLVIVAQEILAGVIWVVIVWGGVLLPIALIAWLFWRNWKKRRSQVK